MNLDSFDALKKRPAIGWLRERDIDLLLCLELSVDGSLRQFLARACDVEVVGFEGAWVSHYDVDGEIDLVVAFGGPNARTILHIENKVAAVFQPEQQERYRMRAKRWHEGDVNTKVRTVLLAPADYLNRSGSVLFDLRISYEELIDVLGKATDPRSLFLGEVLAQGVESYRQGYTAVPDRAVSDVWATFYKIARDEQPRLNLRMPPLKAKGAGFIRCPDAEGFSSSDRKRAVIILKKRRIGECHIDLQFTGVSDVDLTRAVSGLLECDMYVQRTAKSASVRIAVPPVDFGKSPLEQLGNIREWLRHAERLRRFFVDHRPLELLDRGRQKSSNFESS